MNCHNVSNCRLVTVSCGGSANPRVTRVMSECPQEARRKSGSTGFRSWCWVKLLEPDSEQFTLDICKYSRALERSFPVKVITVMLKEWLPQNSLAKSIRMESID